MSGGKESIAVRQRGIRPRVSPPPPSLPHWVRRATNRFLFARTQHYHYHRQPPGLDDVLGMDGHRGETDREPPIHTKVHTTHSSFRRDTTPRCPASGPARTAPAAASAGCPAAAPSRPRYSTRLPLRPRPSLRPCPPSPPRTRPRRGSCSRRRSPSRRSCSQGRRCGAPRGDVAQSPYRAAFL